jgi:hypothetical protein
MSELPLEAARESGLIREGEPLLVMCRAAGTRWRCSTSPIAWGLAFRRST